VRDAIKYLKEAKLIDAGSSRELEELLTKLQPIWYSYSKTGIPSREAKETISRVEKLLGIFERVDF